MTDVPGGDDPPSTAGEPDAAAGLVGQVVFRPVRPGNALEDTVARLMQTIRLGVVAPGDALPSERELALRFSVSRDTVREAIRELAGAGFLVSKRGRYGGTFVSDPHPVAREIIDITVEDLDDVLGLREIVEVGAARAAAGRSLSAGERETLFTALREVGEATAVDYRRLDSRLHLAIAEAAAVPSVVPIIAENRTRINELLDSFPLLPRNIEHSNAQHDAVVLAILAGQPEIAGEAMREHLAGSAALLRGFLG